MKCVDCGKNIPKERLEVMPQTKHCVKCSKTEKLMGFTAWDKTTPILEIVSSELVDKFWAMEKIDGRLSRLK